MYSQSRNSKRVENGLVGLMGIAGLVALVIVGAEACDVPEESAQSVDCSIHGHDQEAVFECMN